MQAFKLALENVRELNDIVLTGEQDRTLVFKIAATIAVDGDITIKQLQRLKNGTDDR